MTITIEPMREEHLPEVMQIERRVFQPGWSEQAFLRDLRNPSALYLILRVDGKIVGYVGGWFIVDECHITNIAVCPEYREQGLGSRLLHRFLSIARERGMRRATLEVRIGNAPAQNLYKKFGFRPMGVRKRYYDDGEDALIMWLDDLDTPEYGAFLQRLASNR
jgi:ribosomal-protein-alanine N-acetyltransferase